MYTYLTLDEVRAKYAGNEGLMNECVVAVYSNRIRDNMYLDFGTREGKNRYLKIMSIAEPLVSDIVKTANDGFAKGQVFKIDVENKHARKLNNAVQCKRNGDFYGALENYAKVYKKSGVSEYLCSGLFRVFCSCGLIGFAGDLLSVAIEIARVNSAQHEYENDVLILNKIITNSVSGNVDRFYAYLNGFSGNRNNVILFPMDYMTDQLIPLVEKYAVQDNPQTTQQPQYDASQMAAQQAGYNNYPQY